MDKSIIDEFYTLLTIPNLGIHILALSKIYHFETTLIFSNT